MKRPIRFTSPAALVLALTASIATGCGAGRPWRDDDPALAFLPVGGEQAPPVFGSSATYDARTPSTVVAPARPRVPHRGGDVGLGIGIGVSVTATILLFAAAALLGGRSLGLVGGGGGGFYTGGL